MARLFISDTHFGHRNVIKYCNRPYDDVAEMDKAIIAQWNSQVDPEDEVYHLGDFGIGKGMSLKPGLVNRLNGKKHIILGNHDAMFNTLHKNPDCVHTHAKVANKYLKAGWNSVDIVKYMMLKDGTNVVLCHMPPDSSHDNRYSEYRLRNNPNFNYIHGHLHAKYLKKDNMIDVGFDGNLKLYTEDDILSMLKKQDHYVPSRLTDFYKENNNHNLIPFEEEVKNGNLRKAYNFNRDLVLYNYTDKCVFDRSWNEVTRVSRGTVYETRTGKIVALSFPKFFNLGEQEETKLDNLPNESYVVTEKMDGSLGIVYYYRGKWRVNTRGSFDSEQAIEGAKILEQYDMKHVPTDLTLLVEIIYPENKIVANYGNDRKFTLLTLMNRVVRTEMPFFNVEMVARSTGMDLVKRYDHSIEKMIELQKTLPKDEEGFVVKFRNGPRVKIKGHEYLRVHKLISHMTPLAFWESMENGKVRVDYLAELPEEYRKDAEELTNKLESIYVEVKKEALFEIDLMLRKIGFVNMTISEDRKRVGLYLQSEKPKHMGAFFKHLDEIV